MTAVLFSLVVHTKKMRTFVFRLKTDFGTIERLLQCSHEETDDQVMFHPNHAIKLAKYHNVAVASADTDVFVCALHHFKQLI